MSKQTLERTFSLREAQVDGDKRTVELSFSSETPVPRFDGRSEYNEVLSHDPGDVDLSRLGDGEHPLLLNHDPERQIGVVETARVDDDRHGRAVVRFSRSQLADEIWQDVRDGIRRKVSVRYQLLGEKRKERKDDGLETRWFRWLPMEVSIVSIPADASVGVGREQPVNDATERKEKTMSEEIKDVQPKQEAAPSVERLAESEAAIRGERKRSSDINAIAKQVSHLIPGVEKRAEAAIAEGWTAEKFNRHVLEIMPESMPEMRAPKAEIPHKDMSRYSIGRLVKGLVNGHVDGLEREVSDELGRATGQSAAGAWLPYAALVNKRDNLFVTGTIGGNISPTNLLSSEYIDALRNRIMVIQMGARVLPGLQGTIILPKLTTPSALTVKTEGAAYATSTPVFGQVTLSPKIVPALVRFTKLLAVQSNPAIEQLVRDDLVRQINIEVDRQCLHGAGSGGEATGIAATAGIGAIVTVAAGAAPSFSRAVSLETEVAIDNADLGALGYLTNPKVRGKLKESLVNTNSPNFAWQINPNDVTGLAMLNGYKAGATNQVKSNLTTGTVTTAASAMFFGNWSDLLVGYFGGGIDLTADIYSVPGWVNLHGQQYFDCAVRHAESFAWDSNLVTT